MLGHALAREGGGRFLLRIEDLDPGRRRPEFVDGIYEDLQWLGVEWDGAPIVQSERTRLYQQALDRLRAERLVYACFCTRAEIAQSLTAPHGDAGSLYPGTCRPLPDDPERRASTPHCWRLDSAKALERAGLEGSLVGFEIDLFAVPGTHPFFAGTSLFGIAVPFVAFDPNRTLTNGQPLPGNAIFSADVYINVTNVTTAAALLDLTTEQQLAALTRLVMHEVGHAIGLGHPNLGINYDTDFDPTNPMPIDPNDPFAALILSPIWNQGAVMSNQPCGPVLGACEALFFTSPTNDDIGGRDALYPVLPEPGIGLLLGVAACAALPRRRRRA